MEHQVIRSGLVAYSGLFNPLWQFLKKRLLGVIKTVARYNERYKHRRDLADMSDHLLKDIGISRADALNEANKPFWKP